MFCCLLWEQNFGPSFQVRLIESKRTQFLARLLVTNYFYLSTHCSNISEKRSWINAIRESSIALSQQRNNIQLPIITNDLVDKIDSLLTNEKTAEIKNGGTDEEYERNQAYRTNTIIHVCWQRNCCITAADYRYALTVAYQ